MGLPPLSEARLYDILLKEEAELRPKADRMWALVRIEPERWRAPTYGSGTMEFWVFGVIGRRVLWYDEIESELAMSTYESYGQIGETRFATTELSTYMEQLIRHVVGEQAYSK